MNRLLIKAPDTVPIDGIDYEINTDFRDCLFTVKQLQDPYFYPDEKASILINNMYMEDPPNQEEAIRLAMWFLRCGEEPKESRHPQYFDFDQDAAYIYSAFLKANIDLDCENLHWWKFIARLPELPESTWSRIVYLRSRGNKRTKEENQECERIGQDVINLKTFVDEAEDAIIQEIFKG